MSNPPHSLNNNDKQHINILVTDEKHKVQSAYKFDAADWIFLFGIAVTFHVCNH